MNARRLLLRTLMVWVIPAAACSGSRGGAIPPGTGSGGFFQTGGFIGSGGVPGTGGLIGAGGGIACGVGSGGTNSVGVASKPQFIPNVGTTHSEDVAPPAISGGTLLVLADGKTAVAADPDRDAVYLVDLPSRTVTGTVTLQAGDEPGRLVQDAAGRVDVALRHGGALVTLDPPTGKILARRTVCPAPRGVAYDPATDEVHVACQDGELVSLPAAAGDPVRRLQLDDDLRDVVVEGNNLLVTRFRSAELLTVAPDGTVTSRVQPPSFSSREVHNGNTFTPSVAWRALPAPGGGAMVLHQRGMIDQVVTTAGGYGGPGPCDTIVHSCISRIDSAGGISSGPALPTLVLAVDMALSPDGQKVAVVSAGNATNVDAFANASIPALTRVFVTDVDSATDTRVGCEPDGMHGPCLPPDFNQTVLLGNVDGPTTTASTAVPMTGAGGGAGGAPGRGGAVGTGGAIGMGGTPGTGGTICSSAPAGVPPNVGQPIAVAFAGDGGLVVQSREPAMLALGDGSTITLSTVSRNDTGHALFHANSGGFLACASCHAEGNEDGRVWNFSCQGPRRTQSVQTGLAGTEPFHWDGDETDFSHLMTDVFQGRMSGPPLSSDQGAAMLSWLDKQPRAPKPAPADASAVARGRTLFQDPTHGCATCHAGAHLTNNQTVDVGTGRPLQVPSLVGVGSRAPYMHDGCAATLADRFGTCGGGDQHGVTSNLSASDVSDLVAYLRTL